MTTTPELKDGLYKFKVSHRIDLVKDRSLDHWDNEDSDLWLKWQGETGFSKVERISEDEEPSLVLPIEYLT